MNDSKKQNPSGREQARIRLLPDELRDQIAAGEVVERPASVLKELLENSLDAGADDIEVRLENGGQSLIAVSDNGCGIAPEDLLLAVASHATSKIASFQDLLRVASYGFRGEALPSIASVSRLEVKSRPRAAKDGEGSFIRVIHGRLGESGPAVLAPGTRVEVRELFSNVPARLKFLKSNATELKRCQDVLVRAALAHPEVSLALYSDGRELCRFIGGEGLLARLERIWPPQITAALCPFARARHGISVRGLASRPTSSQVRADRMLFYVNGRPVQDRLLQRAAKEAYKGRLISREYPQVVLFLELDPEEVDVNVHPAKSEVRFRDERAVFSAVLHGVQESFSGLSVLASHSLRGAAEGQAGAEELFPPLGGFGSGGFSAREGAEKEPGRQERAGRAELGASPESPARPLGFWGSLDEPLKGIAPESPGAVEPPARPSFQAFNREAAAAAPRFSPSPSLREGAAAPFSPDWPGGAGASGQIPPGPFPAGSERSAAEAADPPDAGEAGGGLYDAPGASPPAASSPTETGPGRAELPQGLEYLGQVADTYLLLRQGAKLLVLDQHAAHEIILMRRFMAEAGAGDCQYLALPLELRLHPSEGARLREIWGDLQSLGFALRQQGESLLLVRGIPPLLERGEALELLRDALAGKTPAAREKGNPLRDLLVMMSCKGAIKAGQKLSRDEALGLIRQWLKTPDPEFCPHGRPAVLSLGARELEKMFKRV